MLGGCGWQNSDSPEMSLSQSLEPGEYVTLHCNRDFAHVIQVRDLEMESYLGSGRLNLITQIFEKGEFFQAVIRGRCNYGRRVREAKL